MTAENYHLKWDCHLSYLNSSIATLYKNEKFADVVLYSSSNINNNCNSPDNGGIPTVGISAHKFILSSCSQFFATMFETAPISSPNGVLYVVLPPDLSHRAIQILVQYMYSGEATVSNDILTEVLRGGEILKIRGLCRSSSSSHHHQRDTTSSSNTAQYGTNGTRPLPQPPSAATHSHHMTSGHSNDIYNANKQCPPPSSSNSCSSRFPHENSQQQHQQFRGLGATVMPKESPVIVKSPKLSQMGGSILVPPNNNKHHSTGGGISINKEVAIDPEDKCCYRMNQNDPSLPQIIVANNGSICRDIACNSCPMSSGSEQIRRRPRRHSNELTANSNIPVDRLGRNEYSEQSLDEHCELQEVSCINYERRGRRGSTGGRVREFFASDNYEHSAPSNPKPYVETIAPRLQQSPHQHNFIPIKQEPTDWSTTPIATENSSDLINRSPVHSPKQPLDFKMPLGSASVKIEVGSVHSADEEEEQQTSSRSVNEFDTFTRLVCEVCKKSFDDPKVWVRHLDTHAQSARISGSQTATPVASSSNNNGTTSNGSDVLAKSYVPKKRRRVSQQENSMDHVTLLCDLCSTSFETPAEWVRHMNNQHTEIELAMFNNKKDSEREKTDTSSSGSNKNSKTSPNSSHPQKRFSTRRQVAPPHKKLTIADHTNRICEICNKKFPTHNTMLIHKKQHNYSSLNNVRYAVRTPSPF